MPHWKSDPSRIAQFCWRCNDSTRTVKLLSEMGPHELERLAVEYGERALASAGISAAGASNPESRRNIARHIGAQRLQQLKEKRERERMAWLRRRID
jgi:hypothetical protein